MVPLEITVLVSWHRWLITVDLGFKGGVENFTALKEKYIFLFIISILALIMVIIDINTPLLATFQLYDIYFLVKDIFVSKQKSFQEAKVAES